MTTRKPRHLTPEYADQFRDEAVAEAYTHYPPYSVEVFDLLASLIGDKPRVVLDVGCGTGELARPLAAFVDEVDAVDPSAAMIEIGREREGGELPNIRWVCQSAEEFPYENGRYGLIVAGASIHWMDWHTVLPRMATSLVAGGNLAVVSGHEIAAPWVESLNSILPQYSTNRNFGRHSAIDELERRHLFSTVGRQRMAPQDHDMLVEDYVELLHARNGFSRQRMTQAQADEFDAAVRELVALRSRRRGAGVHDEHDHLGASSGPRRLSERTVGRLVS